MVKHDSDQPKFANLLKLSSNTTSTTRCYLIPKGLYRGGSHCATPCFPESPTYIPPMYRIWALETHPDTYEPSHHTCVAECATLRSAIRMASAALTTPSPVAPYQSYHIVGNGKHVAGQRGARRPRKMHPQPLELPESCMPEIEPSAKPIWLYRDETLVGCYHTMGELKEALPAGRAPWHWRVVTHGVLTHIGRSRRSLLRC